MFDITEQKQAARNEDQGIDVHIHGLDDLPMFFEQDGEEKPVTITVVGSHSSRCRRFEEQLRKRKLKPSNLTGKRIYDDNIEKTAHCSLDWQGFFMDGKEVPFSQHNVKEVYVQCPWVLEQVLEAMNDHARFFESGSQKPQSTSDMRQD